MSKTLEMLNDVVNNMVALGLAWEALDYNSELKVDYGYPFKHSFDEEVAIARGVVFELDLNEAVVRKPLLVMQGDSSTGSFWVNCLVKLVLQIDEVAKEPEVVKGINEVVKEYGLFSGLSFEVVAEGLRQWMGEVLELNGLVPYTFYTKK